MSILTELYIELLASLFYSDSDKATETPVVDNVVYVDFKTKKRKAA